jgi:hypothetical protein
MAKRLFPSSRVEEIVRDARLGRLAAGVLESALRAGAALFLCLAAGLVSGAGEVRGELVAAAALAGVATGLASWQRVRASPAGVARLLDRRLGFDGALATAFEVAGAPGRGELAELLVERVGARLERGAALRAAWPSFAWPIAALCAAAALFAAGGELSPKPASRTRAELVRELVSALEAAGQSVQGALVGAEPDAALAKDLQAVLEAARELGPEPRESGVAELTESLEGLLSRASPKQRDDLLLAQGWLAALSGDLPASGAAGARGSETGSAAEAVTGASPEGTIGGSTPPSGGGVASAGSSVNRGPDAPAGVTRPAGRSEAGTTADVWWPERHDGVVSRWVLRSGSSGSAEKAGGR